MTFSIGSWRVSPDKNEIVKGAEKRALEHRAMRVLEYLYLHRGKVVSRDELLEHVWGRTAISDHSVSIVISDLRKALGDDQKNPKYIRTVPKKGYVLDVPAEGPITPPKKSQAIAKIFASAIGVVVSVFLYVVFLQSETTPAQGFIIKVADIEALGISQEYAFLPVTLTDLIVAELAQTQEIRVKRLRSLDVDTEAGRLFYHQQQEEGPGLVLTGILSEQQGQLVLSLQLEDTANSLVVWGDTAIIQPERFYLRGKGLAGQIMTALGYDRPGEIALLSDVPGVEELYWRALYSWESRQPGGTHLAYENLVEAIERDPDYPRARALLAIIYSHKTAKYLRIGDASTFELAERQLAGLGEGAEVLPETHIARALIAFYRDADAVQALEILNAAPAGVSKLPLLHQTKGMVLSALGRHEESLNAIEDARLLDPFSHSINWDRVWFLYLAGEYEAALAAAQQTLTFSSHPHYNYFALIEAAIGNEREAYLNWVAFLGEDAGFTDQETQALEAYSDNLEEGYVRLWAMVQEKDVYVENMPTMKAIWLLGEGNRQAASETYEALVPAREDWMSYWKTEIPIFANLHP